jgi:hypothetical protein
MAHADVSIEGHGDGTGAAASKTTAAMSCTTAVEERRGK